MSFFPAAFRIEPGADQVIRLAVEKSSGDPKECWDIVFVQDLPQKRALTRSGLQYVFRTGVKVYVGPGNLTRDAAVTGMSLENVVASARAATKRDTLPQPRQRLVIEFRNRGQVHLRASGRVEVRRLDNSVAAEIVVHEFPTLRGALRKLVLDVPPSIAPGRYIALALIDFHGAEIAAGQLELDLK